MNKKFMIGIAILALSLNMAGNIFASTLQGEVVQEEMLQKQQSSFVSTTGKVTDFVNEKDNCELQIGDIDEGIIFNLGKDVVIFDADSKKFVKNTDIKEGMLLTVVYPKDAPMTLSLPARCGDAKLIIIREQDSNVEVNYFNEALVNEENTLALNISETTLIKNTLTETKTNADIKNKNVVAIYTNSTRSIPAQTTPDVVLIMEEDVKYRSLREFAKENDFKVSWENATKTVTLSNNEEKLSFTVGKSYYTCNGEIIHLEYPIKLEHGNVMFA